MIQIREEQEKVKKQIEETINDLVNKNYGSHIYLRLELENNFQFLRNNYFIREYVEPSPPVDIKLQYEAIKLLINNYEKIK